MVNDDNSFFALYRGVVESIYKLMEEPTLGEKLGHRLSSLGYGVVTGEVSDVVEEPKDAKFAFDTISKRSQPIRGFFAVLIWFAAILVAWRVSVDATISAEAEKLLAGRDRLVNGTVDNGELATADSWYSVIGFNIMQLIVLASIALFNEVKRALEGYKMREACPGWFFGLLTQIVRYGLDLALFFVSIAAVWYSLKAFDALTNLQPDGDDVDANNDLILLFITVGLQILTLLELRHRQGMKGFQSIEKVIEDQEEADAKAKNVLSRDALKDAGIDLSAKKNLRIHNFY